MKERWTKEEERALLDGIGSFGWQALIRRSGHSRRAIWDKIRHLFGGGGITRGSYSIRQAMEETGYSLSQLERAASALNQRWQRTAKGGNFLISAEQLEDLANWLVDDFWSVGHRLYSCPGCNATTREKGVKGSHFSNGLCRNCYRATTRYMKLKLGIKTTPQALLEHLQNPPPPIRSRLEGGRLLPLKELKDLTCK